MTAARKLVLMLSVSALVLGPVASAFNLTGFDTAYAKGGNGGGGNGGGDGGGGQSGGNSDAGKSAGNGAGKSGGSENAGHGSAKTESRAARSTQTSGDAEEGGDTPPRGHGSIASQLKGLNAAHASAQAFANANKDSRVGQIAAYMVALQASDALAEELEGDIKDAQTVLDGLKDLTESELLAEYPVFDPALYDAAIDAVDGDPAALQSLQGLDADSIIGTYGYPAGYDPNVVTEPPLTNADILAQFGEPQLYTEAKDALAPSDADELARLISLTDAEKLADFPSTELFDAEAWAADIEQAGITLDDLNKQLSDAEKAELDALLAASDGRTLTPEAKAYLDRLLTGRVSQSDAEAVEELLVPQG